jgi:hypothetical protein
LEFAGFAADLRACQTEISLEADHAPARFSHLLGDRRRGSVALTGFLVGGTVDAR